MPFVTLITERVIIQGTSCPIVTKRACTIARAWQTGTVKMDDKFVYIVTAGWNYEGSSIKGVFFDLEQAKDKLGENFREDWKTLSRWNVNTQKETVLKEYI